MEGNKHSDIPRTTISLDQLTGREKERKEAAKAEEKQRKLEEKEARKASGGGGGFSRLFKRSPSRSKEETPAQPASPAVKKQPPNLTVGTSDANRLRPDSALDVERPGSAQSHRSGGSGSLLTPTDRPPKSPSLWERPTRSREGDAVFGDR